MRIEVRSGPEGLGADQRVYVERAAALALGRFGPKVSLVSVTVETDTASGPAVPRRRVAVRLDGACRLRILESDVSVETALIRALDRTRRHLDREAARLEWRRRHRAGRPSGAGSRAGRDAGALATPEDETR